MQSSIKEIFTIDTIHHWVKKVSQVRPEVLAGIGALVAVGGLLVGVWLWRQPRTSSAFSLSQAYSQFWANQYRRKVSQLVDFTVPENTAVLAVTDINKLRESTLSMSDLYQGVENGDQLILFDEQMIVYRPRTNQIIYQGPDPKKVLDNAELTVKLLVQQEAKVAGMLKNFPDEMPEVLKVSEVKGLQATDPEFYKDLKLGDIVGTFPQNKIQVLLRLGENKIITAKQLKENSR